MSKPVKYLEMAANFSRWVEDLHCNDARNYCFGGVGIRSDGARVYANNGDPKEPEPRHHCEYRLCRKLDVGSVVYVARTLAKGDWANARPCGSCQIVMASRGVKKCYFTIGYKEYGCLLF